jgi:hypothetical protein
MMEEEEVRREDVQGMELKKVSEEVREEGGMVLKLVVSSGGVGSRTWGGYLGDLETE